MRTKKTASDTYMKVFMACLLVSVGTSATIGCANKSSFSVPSSEDGFSGDVFYNNKVDILFVVDNSPSTQQYQERLSAKVGDMVTTLNSLKMDYRVAVTTTTMCSSCPDKPMSRSIVGSPKYLTSSNINLLADRLIVGQAGSDREAGLDSMAWVTSNTYLNSISSDFLRSDALLALVFIGDEDDQSSEFGDASTNDFVNLLDTRKPAFENGARAWLANYIGIVTNQSCDILGGHVSIGEKYIRLVDASKGVKSSICNADLSSAVANIKARIVDQITAYRFKDHPNKSTIQVTVGGRAILEDGVNGWTLETELGTNGQTIDVLRFHGSAIPAANEKVDVKYSASGAS